jgi:hypothetical protein
MFKRYTVANWMADQGIPQNEAANKYTVGQDLTYAQAKDILHLVAQAMGFTDIDPIKRDSWQRCGDPYRKVLYKYAALIEAKKKRGSNWDHMLWVAMDEEAQIACNALSKDYFAYKFNMAKRLKEIYARVPTGYQIPQRGRASWF